MLEKVYKSCRISSMTTQLELTLKCKMAFYYLHWYKTVLNYFTKPLLTVIPSLKKFGS